MSHRVLSIVNQRGLHARASAKFVKHAEEFDAIIEVSKDGSTVLGTSIMGLMMLSAAKGDQISIKAEGTDSQAALDALEKLVAAGFHEDT
jgi:phosphocarrier protein HPr